MSKQKILSTEFSEDFVEKMKDRMLVSYYKYGSLTENRWTHESMRDIGVRLQKYRDTGNTEWLVDAANFCMIEYMYPTHNEAHFRGTDSDESPGVSGRTVKDA